MPRAIASPSATARFYLPHLDGLRFAAFLLVFAHHLPQAPEGRGAEALGAVLRTVQAWGWTGVEIFFALSAYLVTALLLKEHAATGRMSVWRFYVRRSLRIWPLYYFALLLGFAVLPALDWPPVDRADLLREHLAAFVVFAGNLSTAIHSYPPGYVLNLLWSVSAEEQFYLVLPLAVLALARAPLRAWVGVAAAVSLAGLALRAAALHGQWPHPAIWVLQFLRPVHGVDRHHHGVGTQDGEMCHHPLRTVLHAQQHPIAAPHAAGPQMRRQALGSVGQLAVAGGRAKEDQRRLVRITARVDFEVVPERRGRNGDGFRHPAGPEGVVCGHGVFLVRRSLGRPPPRSARVCPQGLSHTGQPVQSAASPEQRGSCPPYPGFNRTETAHTRHANFGWGRVAQPRPRQPAPPKDPR